MDSDLRTIKINNGFIYIIGGGKMIQQNFCPYCKKKVIIICGVCKKPLKSYSFPHSGGGGYNKCINCGNIKPICSVCKRSFQML